MRVLLVILACATCGPDGPQQTHAEIVSVEATGLPGGGYRFSVGVESPDTGCRQYADWWEVVSLDGELIYRRPLAHSHVDEQPFVRDGGPIGIEADTEVWVRAHMHPSGYGGVAMRGSVERGFVPADPPANFVRSLAAEEPQPPSCRW